jgi:hypothetical protein
MSVAWMPIGKACRQLAFRVSDVWRSQRTTRNASSESCDAQDSVPHLVTGQLGWDLTTIRTPDPFDRLT